MKCQKCGMEHDLKLCPNCGVKAKKPISKGRKIAGIIIGILGILMIFSTAINWEDTSTNSPSVSNSNEQQSEINEKSESKKESVIYSDSDLKITFNKIADGKDLGVTACYIYLKVENLGSKTVNVSLTDAYANDTAVTVMSGLPMKLAPGKNSQQPFLFGYNEIFTSADEVEKLEFKVTLYDENYTSIVKTTGSITVNVK